MASLKKNLGYQTVYQVLNTCLPLITAPYLSRVLGATQLGIQSYVSSVSSYFALFAMTGIVNYGTRTIATQGKDKERVSNSFWQIYIIQLISSTLMCMLYFVYFLLCKENKTIVLIQGIAVFSCLFDIGWLFFGLEHFEITVKRNIVVRIVTVILTLVVVKEPDDLWKYVLIMVMSTLINNVILWGFLKNEVRLILPKRKNVYQHIKPILILFIPLLALSVYHLMDKTMLGLMSNYAESGYYYNADKIVNIPIGILIGVGTVLLPRISSLLKQKKNDEANNLFTMSLETITLASIAISCGIVAISNEFVPFFFGKGYDACILLTIVLSPVLIVKSLSLTARNAYLIPHERDKIFVWSVVAGAIANGIANFILIPMYGALGAVLGTLIAEIVSCLWQFMFIIKEINIVKVLANGAVYLLIGITMIVCVRLVASVMNYTLFVKLLIEIAVGGTVFCVLTIIYWKISKNNYILDGILKKK